MIFLYNLLKVIKRILFIHEVHLEKDKKLVEKFDWWHCVKMLFLWTMCIFAKTSGVRYSRFNNLIIMIFLSMLCTSFLFTIQTMLSKTNFNIKTEFTKKLKLLLIYQLITLLQLSIKNSGFQKNYKWYSVLKFCFLHP